MKILLTLWLTSVTKVIWQESDFWMIFVGEWSLSWRSAITWNIMTRIKVKIADIWTAVRYSHSYTFDIWVVARRFSPCQVIIKCIFTGDIKAVDIWKSIFFLHFKENDTIANAILFIFIVICRLISFHVVFFFFCGNEKMKRMHLD